MTMECEIVVIHLTERSYATFNPWTQKNTVSVFHGTALEQITFFHTQDPMLPIPANPFK